MTDFPPELFNHWQAPFRVKHDLFVLQSNYQITVSRSVETNEPIPRGWGGIQYLSNGEAIMDAWEAWFEEQGFESLEQIAEALNKLWEERSC